MWLIKIGSFLLILLVALATSETVEKPTDASVDASENNTEIPGVTESVTQVSSSNTTEAILKILNEEDKGPRSRSETEGETEEVVKLEREALLEKRSIGNIARLLLGGNVPPNHPLVKNPEPKTFNLASNIVASVPGREYGSGWNTGSGWNSNNALAQISALLSTKQRLIPHLSQVTSGVTGLAGVKGELFRQIQTISSAAIAQAAADAAAKAVVASAAAQAVTNQVANAVHQTPSVVEHAIHNNNLQGWYSNQQNTYASLPAASLAAATQTNNIITPLTQSSQISNQYRQATVQTPQSNYHPSYAQYQQQQQLQQQGPNTLYNNQPSFNNNYNSPASSSYNSPQSNNFNTPASNSYNSPQSINNFNSPSSTLNNNYNPLQSNNFNSPASNNFNAAPSTSNYLSTPLIAVPTLNQASASTGVPGSAVSQSQSSYNTLPQTNSATFNSASNSFGAAPLTNNAQQYSPTPSGNSYNSIQQFPPAQNYGGYNSNTNAFNNGGGSSNNNNPNNFNNNNNNYNRNPSVGGPGSSPGYVSGQHSQPAGSHVYPQNGPGYSGPPPGNFNSPSGVSGSYPNTYYNPSSSSSAGNQYSGNGNGPQNFQHPGPPYNSPETNFNQGPPAPFNAPPSTSSYSGANNQNFGPQGQSNSFSGYGNSHLNRPFNYEAASSNINNNYTPSNNYNRHNSNDNRQNSNDNRQNNNDNRQNSNDNRFNSNDNRLNSNDNRYNDNNNNNNNNGNRPLYDNRNNNNNYNRNTYDNSRYNNNNNIVNSSSKPGNSFQGHSRFNNGASRYSSQNQSSRKGGEPNRYSSTRRDEEEEVDDFVDKREWSSNSHKHDDEKEMSHVITISAPYDSDREDRPRRIKPVYKESYNPHKHRWTEHPPRRGQIDDRPNLVAHPKSKFGATRRSHNGQGQRSRGRKPEQPREVYSTLPEYVYRNERPHRSANQSAFLIPLELPPLLPLSSVDEDFHSSSTNVSPNSQLDTDISSTSSGTGTIVGSSSSLPATLTINLPSAEDPKIIPAITVFETSFIS